MCVCVCVCGKQGRYVDPVKGVDGGVFCREHKARESVDMVHRYVCMCMYVCV
jgi:hypothetical protein